MLIVEIDVIDAQPLQRGVACSAYVFGLPVGADPAPVVAPLIAELRGHDDLVAASADRLPHQLFVRERTVHVGRIEEVDAQVERALNRRDRL